MKWILGLCCLILPALSQAQFNPFARTDWRVMKTQWSAQDEENFSRFVARLGAAVENRLCDTVKNCLKSDANPYYSSDPAGLVYYADCADLPYFLRAYFAWKNGLPMSVASRVSARPVAGNTGDIRYTPQGNYVTGRFDVIAGNGRKRFAFIENIEDYDFGNLMLATRYPNAVALLNGTITSSTLSATFRMMGTEDGKLYADFYPVKLTRYSVRPGTVIYDPNGHVAVVYKITADGQVYYIDSHPDNTLTSGMYNPKFERSNPYQGAGFKNFRPLTLVDARQDSSGAYVGGRVVGAKNTALPYYSLEQFFGTNPDPDGKWSKGRFVYNGRDVDYYEYLRIMMANGELRIDPLVDMQVMVRDLCVNLKDRVQAVDVAVQSGVQNKPHPERLPYNIYGTTGEWEQWASPSRDARLKVSFANLLIQIRSMVQRHSVGDPTIVYRGNNLRGDLLSIYQREATSCQFAYRNSSGVSVPMNLEQARQRVFDMSFDPYHCAELRWGAKTSQELASCRDNQNKRAWYAAERWLRYQTDRTYDARMDYSLGELTGPKPGVGVANPPDVDIVRFLQTGVRRH
ncbi:hypothetical protein ACLVWU_13255 [Bdellovibrio sp. HCB290]|uniref:hypothetical protein n=1 Tax=Bdellovibrio sp. HCB290 TaxID=3394356 RepID=UPI0039B4EDD4